MKLLNYINMKSSYKGIITAGLIALSLNACKKGDLNTFPTNDVTADKVYANSAGYKNELVKLYATYALTSPSGSDNSDVGGLNAGFADFLRLFWTSQELTTDEAVCAWNDTGIPDMNKSLWTADNQFLRGLYSRSLLQITVCNEFLRESTPEKLAARGIAGADADNVLGFNGWFWKSSFCN
jgi:hypothetical protein